MFKFTYHKLLEYQQQQEDVARRDYFETVELLDLEKARYQKMFKDQDIALEEVFVLKSRDMGVSIMRLNELDNFVDGMKFRIEKQREIVIAHTHIVEHKQEILQLAAKERKILEKLKEKKHADYKKLMKKAEFKRNDELVVTRHRKGA